MTAKELAEKLNGGLGMSSKIVEVAKNCGLVIMIFDQGGVITFKGDIDGFDFTSMDLITISLVSNNHGKHYYELKTKLKSSPFNIIDRGEILLRGTVFHVDQIKEYV